MNPATPKPAGPTDSARAPLIACILVLWNNWQHTERCLNALALQDYSNLLVIAVDNNSTDGSVDRLRSKYPSVLCIENGYNAGFAKACNVGAHHALSAGADFLWFLNNDTEAPPQTASMLLAKAEADPRIGIVGAVLLYMDSPSTIQACGGGSISLWSGYNRHFLTPAPLGPSAYITFASAFVRGQTFQELGGLWEGAFMYFEDSDFSLRASHAGWTLAVAENTRILHAENGSAQATERGNRRSPLLDRIQTTSGILFLARHGHIPPLSIAIFLALRLGKRLVRGDWQGMRAVLAGIRDWRSPNPASHRQSA